MQGPDMQKHKPCTSCIALPHVLLPVDTNHQVLLLLKHPNMHRAHHLNVNKDLRRRHRYQSHVQVCMQQVRCKLDLGIWWLLSIAACLSANRFSLQSWTTCKRGLTNSFHLSKSRFCHLACARLDVHKFTHNYDNWLSSIPAGAALWDVWARQRAYANSKSESM